MHTHDFIFDEGGDGQVVEKIRELFPHIRAAILLDTLVVEAVDVGDRAGLVVTADEEDTVFIADFIQN